MRKQFLFLFLALILTTVFQAQTRGTKVGYIDMEYILQNVPDYTEAQNQLEQKAQKWKQEIESKKIEINKLKEALKAEKALLTKGLIEERIAEIDFLENENLEYQQKRFGPQGDLMTQKTGLTKPIQDQVFTAVQDIAETKKYDFIFDKTSDLTMLFAAKRFDISDQIIRVLNRTEKREQLTKKQLKEEEAREAQEDAIEENPALAERKKALDARKAIRDKVIADRIQLQEERKKAAEDRRLQIISDREAKKAGIAPTTISKSAATSTGNDTPIEDTKAASAQARQKILDDRAATLEARKKVAEDNRKAQEEKRKQILADKEAKRTGTITAPAQSKTITTDVSKKTGTVSESTTTEEVKTKEKTAQAALDSVKSAAEEAKQKQIDARAKALEDRKKVIEDRKKELEEKKKKVLEDREAARKANVEKLKTTKDNTNTN